LCGLAPDQSTLRGRPYVRTLGWEDALQAGCLGLVEAARRYDPAKGAYTNYALWYIRSVVQTAAEKQARYSAALDTDVSVGGLDESLVHDLAVDPVAETDAELADREDEMEAAREGAARVLAACRTRRERQAVEAYLAGHTSYASAGAAIGVTRERARQLIVRLRDRLREG
jgi:RNA polymerase sigma factor (sigma-70 family)